MRPRQRWSVLVGISVLVVVMAQAAPVGQTASSMASVRAGNKWTREWAESLLRVVRQSGDPVVGA